ncbi:DUF742 domain-containing protein [Streptomyces sp. NPDC059837]|uniref:DUF742 domain-containing protein n=1 Tax=unclassified Streptomyces TaxID=2593676 RepID=UPI00224DBC7B|nr:MULTISPECIES: DUF742 domain-containing protein [unclassified Streptomyces]MCX4408398.1 DUF742 domain-containing protein [Streptomyces sp. NBC_01764]MCX5185643.1 DUF742 domain-containing protein [Streptomyces sp. NBC_00268]
MSHWADAAPDDEYAEESFIRPYTITQGRTTSARDDLTLITVIATVVAPDEQLSTRGLQPEHRLILQLCRTPVALAEVAAELNLPVAVTKILVSDLIALGRVTARPPLAVAVGQGLDMTLLQAVKDGLLRL